MRYWFGFLAFLVLLAGCGPELSKNDLGTVIYDVPKVAGSDQPYPMPQLGPPHEDGDEEGNTVPRRR
jgi:hypothetical protein